jgi:uncharacterized protein
MMDLKLTEIYIYPVKSLRGISLPASNAGIRGLMHDRRFLLVDEDGVFLTQRIFPEMATFAVDLSDAGFIVSKADDQIHIPFEPPPAGEKTINIWKDHLKALLAPEYFSEWFSMHLGHSCKLVFMDDSVKRPVPEEYKVNNEEVSFADAFPYLIIGASSLDDLNGRLEAAIPMNRFRPNLVFSGGIPFIEDSFGRFGIGDAVFKAVKPCARCIVTTTDQHTGRREKEPLATLSTYRKSENKVLFGQNLLCLREGVIRTGDRLVLPG